MSAPAPSRPRLAGLVPGVATLALLMLGLRLLGVAPLLAYAVALAAGLAVTAVVCRRRGGPEAQVGLALVLTASYSMLAALLVTFLLAVIGQR